MSTVLGQKLHNKLSLTLGKIENYKKNKVAQASGRPTRTLDKSGKTIS